MKADKNRSKNNVNVVFKQSTNIYLCILYRIASYYGVFKIPTKKKNPELHEK